MRLASRADARAAELADRHYSRQTRGARQYMPPGRCVAFVVDEAAVWTAVLNVFRGEHRWRNTLFRNESSTRSSEIVALSTLATYAAWAERYEELPPVPLRTEVDIEATAGRRSRYHEPGHCYRIAGWREVARVRRAKRRETRVVLEAPHWFFVAMVIAHAEAVCS